MADIETRRELGACPVRAINLQQKIPEDCAAENSHCESRDADAGREQNAAENNSDVVDDRRKRRDYELAFRVLHRAKDAAFVKTNLRGKHDASKKNHALAFRGIEAGR